MKFRDYDNYEIYEDGRIWSYKSNKFLKPQKHRRGYQLVRLSDNEGKQKTYKVHRVVYEAVSGSKIPDGLQINHINECKTDNRFCNLNLMTCKENLNFGTRNERASKAISKAMRNNPKISKAVGAFKNNELIMTFPSTKEAQRQGFNQGAVASCCRGEKKTYKGYEWCYIETKKET